MIDPQHETCRLRAMTEQDLATVLAWRNHPAVREVMFRRHEIDLQEHRSWFERSVVEDGRHLLVFEIGGLPQGFVNLHVSSADSNAEWGFYLAPATPPGTGRRLGITALDHAFDSLGVHKLSGQVLALNHRSIKFHRALGFVEEGVLREQHFDGHCYQDVVCFGLLHSERHVRK